MKLTRLHLEGFGILVEEDFEFGPELNVILGPNEAGKSTMQQAILAMLYGFYQRERLTAREKQAHAKYKPWASSQYAGSLYLSIDNNSTFLLTRRFDSPEPDTQIYDTQTGVDITNQFLRKRRGFVDFCERQLGMSRQVFEAVACVKQGQLAVLTEPEARDLSDAIMRLLDSASADVSIRTVQDRLASALRSLGTERSKSGPLYRARQALQEGEHQLEKRKSLTLSLETDYHKAAELRQQIKKYDAEEFELEYKLKVIELRELRIQVQRYEEVSSRRKLLETQLEQLPEAHPIPTGQRDQVIKLMEERKLVQQRQQELYTSLRDFENARAAARQELEALPVAQEFWSGTGDREFHDLMRQWERLHALVQQTQHARKQLEARLLEKGIQPEVFEKFQHLDSSQVEEMRKLDQIVQEKKEDAARTSAEIKIRRKYSNRSRLSVGALLIGLLLIVLIAQIAPESRLGEAIRSNVPDTIQYLISGLLALWLAMEFAYGMSIRTLQEEYEGTTQTLLLAKSELRSALEPYSAHTFDALLDTKLKFYEIQQFSSAETGRARELTELQEKIQKWLELFKYSDVSRENLSRVAEKLQQGRHQWNYIQELNGRITGIESELAQKNKRLETINLYLKSALENANCWTGTLESDVETYLDLAEKHRRYEGAARELDQVIARELELLQGRNPKEFRERLEQLEDELGEDLPAGDNPHVKTLQDALLEVREQKHNLNLELAAVVERISERESQMPDLSEIEETMEAAREQIEELTVKRQALELAIETLNEVARKAHTEFAPRLARMVGSHITHVTHGRYKELYIDPSDFSIRIAHGRAKTLVPVDFLSFGTQEQIYLLLRASIAQLFSTTAEKVPLLFDDPLTHADESRQSAALETLAAIAESQQIFYFTKDQSIIDALAAKQIEYNLIVLQQSEGRQPMRWAAGTAVSERRRR